MNSQRDTHALVNAVRMQGRLVMKFLDRATYMRMETPVGAASRGAVSGLAATLLLSVLARILPGMRNRPAVQPMVPPPADDAQDVREWQARAQSPAAFQKQAQGEVQSERARSPAMTPAGALVQPQSPGPEGLAEQFAFKVASGLFARDITPYMRPAGLAVHVTYGAAWGMLYGLLQATYRRPPGRFGALYGLVVWLVGPAFLVPAMKLMGCPTQEQPLRTATMLVGHIAYGTAVATTFEALEVEP